jgi:hypothetical protein
LDEGESYSARTIGVDTIPVREQTDYMIVNFGGGNGVGCADGTILAV